jgi:hypothetical protein
MFYVCIDIIFNFDFDPSFKFSFFIISESVNYIFYAIYILFYIFILLVSIMAIIKDLEYII